MDAFLVPDLSTGKIYKGYYLGEFEIIDGNPSSMKELVKYFDPEDYKNITDGEEIKQVNAEAES